MRGFLVFALLLALPGIYLFWNDCVKYRQSPAQGFHISTIGEVWLEHDRAGFQDFKAKYKRDPRQWDQEIRPILDWQALPLAVLPAIVFYLFLFLCWLLGRGPFSGWSINIPHGEKGPTGSGFSRLNADKRGSNISYRRK